MTVMLLQRSATPQLTHSQKSASAENAINISNSSAEQPPFLILLDIQEHAEPLERESSGYDSYNNNGLGAAQSQDKSPRKNIAVIGRSSTCGSAAACGGAGGFGGAGGAGAPKSTPGGPGPAGAGGLQLQQQQSQAQLLSQQNPAAGGLAMRYYRLWIYACNLVLLCSAVGFAAAVSHTLLFSGDLRRYLVPGVPRAHDPSALYAYLAFAVQLGLVQLLGCVAARRLSVRLLNAYWLILLALLAGDAVLGIAWVFRFERMRAELRPSLRLRLQVEYGKDTRFSEQWDQLQREYKCCGVTGPLDFGSFWPEGCCPAVEPVPASLNLDTWSAASNESTPGTTTTTTTTTTTATTTALSSSSQQQQQQQQQQNSSSTSSSSSSSSSSGSGSLEPCQNPMTKGCEVYLLDWLRQTADLLFVLGFCVIAFTKLCFLGILRYEIREMIQKIRLMREPPPSTVPFIQSLGLAPPAPPPQQQQQQQQQQLAAASGPAQSQSHQPLVEIPLNNGNIARRTTLPIVNSHANCTGTTSVYVPGDESSKHPLLGNSLQDAGADSDTNSHCALILEESTPPAQHHATAASAAAAAAAAQKSNGNNNYEMREFNRRLLFSSGSNAASSTTGQAAPSSSGLQIQQQQQQSSRHT